MITRLSKLGFLSSLLIMVVMLSACGIQKTGEATPTPIPSLLSSPVPPTLSLPLPVVQLTALPTVPPTPSPTPTPVVLGPLFDADLDIIDGPVEVPLVLEIPALQVNAPVLGVGLTSSNEMDAPKGPIDDPVWHSAFWYRGSGLPGESGTATIAGHLSDSLGRDEIFVHLEDLKLGDSIIIHYTEQNLDFTFTVDQVVIYSLEESSDPAMLEKIFGTGPATGKPAQPSPDGISRLTLITCTGSVVNGRFDHHVVVFASLKK
jgi:LPXTG-site transpeptidase (sortase) family protein